MEGQRRVLVSQLSGRELEAAECQKGPRWRFQRRWGPVYWAFPEGVCGSEKQRACRENGGNASCADESRAKTCALPKLNYIAYHHPPALTRNPPRFSASSMLLKGGMWRALSRDGRTTRGFVTVRAYGTDRLDLANRLRRNAPNARAHLIS